MIMFGITAFMSCEKEGLVNSVNETKRITENRDALFFNSIKEKSGNLHNEFLDSLYLYMPEKLFNSQLSDSTIEWVKDYALGFYNRRGYSEEIISMSYTIIDEQKQKIIETGNFKKPDLEKISIHLKNDLIKIKNEISNFQEITIFEKKINVIYNTALNNPNYTDDEKESIALISGVAISSAKYWRLNLKRWKKTEVDGNKQKPLTDGEK